MRSVLGKAVRKAFAARVASDLPDFVELKGHMIYSGDRLYTRATPEAALFLRWVPHKSSHDEFTVEYGWSSSGAPPRKHDWASKRDDDPLSRDGHSFRISKAADPPRKEHWWVLSSDLEDAMAATRRAFAREGDRPIDTLVRASSAAGVAHTLAVRRETPIDEILARIPELVDDCFACISLHVLPYFEAIREARRRRA
jgi:hypothetical protein